MIVCMHCILPPHCFYMSAITYDFTGQNITLLQKYPKSNFLDHNSISFRFSSPKIGEVLMKTFSKGSFIRFFQNIAPGGGIYQISPDVARTTCIQIYSKRTQKAIFWTLAACLLDSAPPKKGGVRTKTLLKGSFTCFYEKMAPGGGGILSDFTRRGTNYLHTTLLITYPKSNFFGLWRMCLGFSAPKIGGVLTKTLLKGSFARFFHKMAPGGVGAFYQISPDVALTTCIQPYSKRTKKAIFWTLEGYVLDSAPRK